MCVIVAADWTVSASLCEFVLERRWWRDGEVQMESYGRHVYGVTVAHWKQLSDGNAAGPSHMDLILCGAGVGRQEMGVHGKFLTVGGWRSGGGPRLVTRG